MNTYIAFLRGINVSGKNKIAMSELKLEFEKLNYKDVSTYLNSGNVVFLSESTDVIEIKSCIESMIVEKFELEIPVYIVKMDRLKDILSHSPLWWGTGDKDKYDNLIFILHEDNPDNLVKIIGLPTQDLEQIEIYDNAIFWTFDRKNYQKCNWWKKTATTGIAEKLTIRTSNTVKKLLK